MSPKTVKSKVSKTKQQNVLQGFATQTSRDQVSGKIGTREQGESDGESPNMHDEVDPDFQSYIKNALSRIEKKVDALNEEQHAITERFENMERKQADFERALTASSDEMTTLRNSHEAVEGRLGEFDRKIKELEAKTRENEEEALRLARYSRAFNLRFGGFQIQQGENCMEIIADLLKEKLGFESAAAMIENAHRVGINGRRSGARPAPHIIVKFMRRTDRIAVLRKAKSLLKQGEIFATEDYTQADYKRKCELRPVMQKAFEQGKRPRFANGRLFIDGKLFKD
uniref:Uncharacterized protein LOC102803427 n=1 Tax=Saccoglossus kowalevskii TaxID=10224 RepID=A0ABM0MT25_SACKO|nr:PREDICTED: uncharacterized protein LOC102803427 [Saccoglossus kowalevskii]